jgi:hypothetical protein
MDTLWQRFGRAAQDPTKEAVAILFAEPKYFDDEKEKSAMKLMSKKRGQPCGESRMDKPPSKRRAHTMAVATPGEAIKLESEAPQPFAESRLMDIDMAVPALAVQQDLDTKDIAAEDSERLRRYFEKADAIAAGLVKKALGRREVEVDEALLDFLNAQARGISCHRNVPKLYKCGMWLPCSIILLSMNLLFWQKRIISSAVQISLQVAPVVHLIPHASVVIYALPPSCPTLISTSTTA